MMLERLRVVARKAMLAVILLALPVGVFAWAVHSWGVPATPAAFFVFFTVGVFVINTIGWILTGRWILAELLD